MFDKGKIKNLLNSSFGRLKCLFPGGKFNKSKLRVRSSLFFSIKRGRVKRFDQRKFDFFKRHFLSNMDIRAIDDLLLRRYKSRSFLKKSILLLKKIFLVGRLKKLDVIDTSVFGNSYFLKILKSIVNSFSLFRRREALKFFFSKSFGGS